MLLRPNPLLPLFPELFQKPFGTRSLVTLQPSNPRLLALFGGSFAPVDLPCCHAGDFTGVGVNALESVLRAQSFPISKGSFGVDFTESLIIDIGSWVDEVQDQLAFESRKPDIIDGPDLGESGGHNNEAHIEYKKGKYNHY
jgi:hypothetical protein